MSKGRWTPRPKTEPITPDTKVHFVKNTPAGHKTTWEIRVIEPDSYTSVTDKAYDWNSIQIGQLEASMWLKGGSHLSDYTDRRDFHKVASKVKQEIKTVGDFYKAMRIEIAQDENGILYQRSGGLAYRVDKGQGAKDWDNICEWGSFEKFY
tara:strand:- start:512 stop:964 length:453 start_codon:yes stop_codon:yes gene_type:complete